MADDLNVNQLSAIARAKNVPALQRLLFKEAKGLKWYAAFKAAGFLDPNNMPRPAPAEQEGYVVVPPWPITDYLLTIAPDLSEPHNAEYTRDVLSFLRASTSHAKSEDFGNYRVWWQFAKIIRHIPVDFIEMEDAEIVEYWLTDRFDRGITAATIGEEWLPGLVVAQEDRIRAFAIAVLRILYTPSINDKRYGTAERKEAVLRIDAYHARKITAAVAEKAGLGLGAAAVEMLVGQLEGVLDALDNDRWSCIWRPAIEEHEQNRGHDDAADLIIEVLREALVAFVGAEPATASETITRLLQHRADTVRRIAIHAMGVHFESLQHLLGHLLVPWSFRSNLQHELWHLFNKRYTQFAEHERNKLLAILTSLRELDEDGNFDEGATAFKMAIWLSAIKDQGAAPTLLYRHCFEVLGGRVPKHPDFASYVTVSSFEEKSPIRPEELVTLSIDELITVVHSYGANQAPGWHGGSLARSVREMLKAEPNKFVDSLERFVELGSDMTYAVLGAYFDLAQDEKTDPSHLSWPKLIEFCNILADRRPFKGQDGDGRVSERLISASIAQLLQKGISREQSGMPPSLYSAVEGVLRKLLETTPGSEFRDEADAMTTAINSPRGHVIESLIALTERGRATLDGSRRLDHESWRKWQPVYEAELARLDEYEFPTIFASRILQFVHFSEAWTLGVLPQVFDRGNHKRWFCAMQGYGYVARIYRPIYEYLKRSGSFSAALSNGELNARIKERVVENVAVGYLSDFEALGPHSLVQILLDRAERSELSHFVWFIGTAVRADRQAVAPKAIALWPLLLEVIESRDKELRVAGARLFEWIGFVDQVDDASRTLILRTIPFLKGDSAAYDVLPQVARIAKEQPDEAFSIWMRVLEFVRPDYPKEDLLKALHLIGQSGVGGLQRAKQIADRYFKEGYDEAVKWLGEASVGQ